MLDAAAAPPVPEAAPSQQPPPEALPQAPAAAAAAEAAKAAAEAAAARQAYEQDQVGQHSIKAPKHSIHGVQCSIKCARALACCFVMSMVCGLLSPSGSMGALFALRCSCMG